MAAVRSRRKPARPPDEQLPALSLIVPAYNEALLLAEKCENCLALDYPSHKLEIIVVTDGSDDDPNAILKQFPAIRSLHHPDRKGKLAAINRAAGQATADILVFTDANTLLNKEALRRMVRHYGRPRVAAVSGEKKIAAGPEAAARGEGIYWKYESFIKKMDARLNTLVGAAGELFSIRRDQYKVIPENIVIEDFVQSMLICARGFKVSYEPAAFAMEKASLNIRDEIERKVRISAGGFQAIRYLFPRFNMFRYPLTAFQYLSHRVLRWTLCPLALPGLFCSAGYLALASSVSLFGWFFYLQVAFYLAALGGWMRAKRGMPGGWLYVPFYFTVMNLCVFAGFARYMAGSQPANWRKAARPEKI